MYIQSAHLAIQWEPEEKEGSEVTQYNLLLCAKGDKFCTTILACILYMYTCIPYVITCL